MPAAQLRAAATEAGLEPAVVDSLLDHDVDRLVDKLLFAGPDPARKRSAFWVLLGLAAVITTAGVFSDSTAKRSSGR